MTYETVADGLEGFDPPAAVALPDGSVDRTVAVHDAGGRVDSRDRFAERVGAGEESFRFVERSTAPGGMATNAARQCHALGSATTLFGHLPDGAVLPFETVDLGDPASVTVATFADGDLVLAEESADLRDCDASRLRDAGAFDRDPGLVCVANWATVPGVTDLLAPLAGVGDGPLVLDVGPAVGAGADRFERLADALRDAGARRRIAVAGNRPELRALADGLGVGADADRVDDALGDLAAALGVTWVVLHETEVAAAASPDGRTTVPNLRVDDPVTSTGGGDRFSAAFGCALAAGWNLAAALGLGNACASYRVATGDTGTPEDLRSFVAARTDRS